MYAPFKIWFVSIKSLVFSVKNTASQPTFARNNIALKHYNTGNKLIQTHLRNFKILSTFINLVNTSVAFVITRMIPVTTGTPLVTTSTLPDITSALLVITSALPVTTSALPVTTSALPVTTIAMPGFTSTMPVSISVANVETGFDEFPIKILPGIWKLILLPQISAKNNKHYKP